MTAASDASTLARASESPGSTTRAGLFVLESRGWSPETQSCSPKVAALASLLKLAEPAAVPSVGYVSRGNLLVISGDVPERARAAAAALAGALHVTLLEREAGSLLAGVELWSG